MSEREESKAIERTLEAVEERFPQYADMAQSLAQESETFREICTDFVECSETLERLVELGAKAEAKIQEYANFKAQLEHELLEWLEARSARVAGAGKNEAGSDTCPDRSKDANNRK